MDDRSLHQHSGPYFFPHWTKLKCGNSFRETRQRLVLLLLLCKYHWLEDRVTCLPPSATTITAAIPQEKYEDFLCLIQFKIHPEPHIALHLSLFHLHAYHFSSQFCKTILLLTSSAARMTSYFILNALLYNSCGIAQSHTIRRRLVLCSSTCGIEGCMRLDGFTHTYNFYNRSCRSQSNWNSRHLGKVHRVISIYRIQLQEKDFCLII